jgi:hypothetical protein
MTMQERIPQITPKRFRQILIDDIRHGLAAITAAATPLVGRPGTFVFAHQEFRKAFFDPIRSDPQYAKAVDDVGRSDRPTAITMMPAVG